MSVSEKDLKILWGKAAGRCAITKKKLVAEASKEIPSQNIVLGEACHIVAENETGPRGKSLLTPQERNSYPNLILLCTEEHTRIDKDPLAWPIEKLHHIKAQHELWVEQQLAEGVDHEGQVYANLVNTITDALELGRWDRICDNAIRGIVPQWFTDGIDTVVFTVFRTNWPGRHPALEAAIQELANRAEAYVKFFVPQSYPDEHHCLRRRKWYKDISEERMDKRMAAVKIFDLWDSICIQMIWNLVHALNEYAVAVQKTIKPSYFFLEGKFCFVDEMGVTNSLDGYHSIPKSFRDLSEQLARHADWMKKFAEGRYDTIWEEADALQKRDDAD